MNCCTKLIHIILTSVTVVTVFYMLDLVVLKYSNASVGSRKETYLDDALAETIAAKEANAPMIRLENTEATLREIQASHREGKHHRDDNLAFYQYKLGLEREYWDNKMLVAIMEEKLYRMNKAKVDQEDPELVKLVRDYWIHPPSIESYYLNSPHLEDFSMGQSEIVNNLLQGKEAGFFVECGALDGETRSNTLFFEREKGWKGLLIEAGPGNYRQMLSKHRNAYMSPACLGIDTYPAKMMFHKGRNRGRLLDNDDAVLWVSSQHMSLSLSDIQCFPLYTFLLALNRTHIDYFSLDVEGAELDVLRTIPFNKISISVLTVEFIHGRGGKSMLKAFMATQGYQMVAEVTRDDRLANDLVFVSNSPPMI